MSFNRGKFNTSHFNIIKAESYSYAGLQLLRCANWQEGVNHGGILTEYSVSEMWDYISEYENINGATDYRKVFVKNFGDVSTGSFIVRPVVEAPNDLVGRIDVKIAEGTASDNMINKPASEFFAPSITLDLDPGESASIWARRTITAGGSPASSYLGIIFYFTASES